VNTVVDSQSATATRGSPDADPALEPATGGLLGAPTGGLGAPDGEFEELDDDLGDLDREQVDDAAVADDPDRPAEAADSAPDLIASDDSAPDIADPEDAAQQEADPEDAAQQEEDGARQEVDADPEAELESEFGPEQGPEQGDVPENQGKCVNLGADGEPPGVDGRLTGVTATLSETAILPEIASADDALAPDSFASSAFEAEERRKPAVWAAADVVTEIYHGHYNQLVRLAVLLVHDVQTAEEVVQDAFEAMHLASRRLRDSEKALQYLRQTVVNRSRSVLRHRKVVDMHAPKPGPDEPSAEHAALAILERSAVAAALRSLPERQREAIALRYYADFSEADIARAMGISKGAVKSHTARAMASLKTILTQETS
jgi:RNA polymerase sigma-70 factor (sigma-E family)